MYKNKISHIILVLNLFCSKRIKIYVNPGTILANGDFSWYSG